MVFFNAALSRLYVAIGDPGVIEVFGTTPLRRQETVATEAGAHTLSFDAARNIVCAFLPASHRAAVYQDRACSSLDRRGRKGGAPAMQTIVQLSILIVMQSWSRALAAGDPAPGAEPDWKAVEQALGKSGQLMPGDVYRIGMPRTDLRSPSRACRSRPGFALGSYAAFKQIGDHAMVMGDLVLLDRGDPPSCQVSSPTDSRSPPFTITSTRCHPT